jgi:hypothetical protein
VGKEAWRHTRTTGSWEPRLAAQPRPLRRSARQATSPARGRPGGRCREGNAPGSAWADEAVPVSPSQRVRRAGSFPLASSALAASLSASAALRSALTASGLTRHTGSSISAPSASTCQLPASHCHSSTRGPSTSLDDPAVDDLERHLGRDQPLIDGGQRLLAAWKTSRACRGGRAGRGPGVAARPHRGATRPRIAPQVALDAMIPQANIAALGADLTTSATGESASRVPPRQPDPGHGLTHACSSAAPLDR